MQDALSHLHPSDIAESIIAMEKKFLSLYNIQSCFVGFEYEFYCISKPNNQFFHEISLINGVQSLKKEIGNWQFEIVTKPHNSFIQAVHEMYIIKNLLVKIAKKHNIIISQNAVTFKDNNPPSSMQISISMLSGGQFLNSSHQNFMKAVHTLVHNLYNSTILTCPTPNCYKRFSNVEIAKQFKNSPTHINWGVENRTLAIRLASINEAPSGQRIEYRTPSPQANPYYVAIAILSSLLCISGIEYPQVFVDSFESTSQKLPQTINEAYNAFVKSSMFNIINTFSYKHAI